MRDLFVIFITVLVIFITVIIVPVFLLTRASCYSQLEVSGLEGTWGPLIDCQVKTTNGHYVPYDRYRVMEQMELKRK